MRKYELSPALIADLRMRSRRPLPSAKWACRSTCRARRAHADRRRFAEADAEDARIEAGGITIGADEDDDDFY